MTKPLRLTALTGAASLAATAGLVGTATSASAAERDGVCEAAEFCLYFTQGFGEPLFDLFVDDADFGDDFFPGEPSLPVNDNTRSYSNQDTFVWRVFDEPNFAGEELLCAAPGEMGDLPVDAWDRASSASLSNDPCVVSP
jgi:hypothetical protein